ncbi:unnamed protein product [Paramecium pentaurelia]|uniref:Ankyrin repeat protein n=1 Tax=Paramecium pentaurelia TaxID=43138 RepID=A0A8S1VU18_9CILI|nr:unnamed protein product [Paramecium pentaurelia]
MSLVSAPKNLKTHLFNLIEQNKTQELIQFIENHRDYIQSLVAPNYWTLGMYAVRYSNHELMKYLYKKDLLLEHPLSQYTLLSTAFLNNDFESFKLLCDEFGKDINKPVHQFQDQTFLQYAIKYNQNEFVEILCSRGAYFIIERTSSSLIDCYANNLKVEQDQIGVKFKSYSDNRDVAQSSILQLKRDKLTPTHYFRFKNILLLQYLIQIKQLQTPEGYGDFQLNFNRILEYTAPSNILD